MPKFYTIGNNSAHNKEYAWVDSIIKGINEGSKSDVCNRHAMRPHGDLYVAMAMNNASKWPDVLGSGASFSPFTVSGGTLDAWCRDGVSGVFIGGEVIVAPPYPKRLVSCEPPTYYWLDDRKMFGASLDLLAAGFIGVQYCGSCGAWSYDISKTYDRQHLGVWPYVIREGSWSGKDLFQTGLGYFCTDAVLESSRRHRLTNCRFIPSEAGAATWSAGIEYLGAEWPVHFDARPWESQTSEKWVEGLRSPHTRYEARRALIALGTDAVAAIPAIVELLDEKDPLVKREAEILLNMFWKMGVPLSNKALTAARNYEEWFEKTLGKPSP